MNTEVMFSSKTTEWATPQAFWEALHQEFHFICDAAARAENAKCSYWFGPGSPYGEDALTCNWPAGAVWLNPPYDKCREFIDKASIESHFGSTVVCLVPARTDTRWWHDYVWDRANNRTRRGVELRFIKGRLKFGGATAGAPFPSVVIIFRGGL